MKILQIIPAEKWYAEYHYGTGSYDSPLVCWALVEDDDNITIVVGMEDRDGDILFTPVDPKKFRGYDYRRN